MAWKMTSPGSRVHERFEQTVSAFTWWGLFLVSAIPRADQGVDPFVELSVPIALSLQ